MEIIGAKVLGRDDETAGRIEETELAVEIPRRLRDDRNGWKK
jgi:hypothetical protein